MKNYMKTVTTENVYYVYFVCACFSISLILNMFRAAFSVGGSEGFKMAANSRRLGNRRDRLRRYSVGEAGSRPGNKD